MIDRRAFFRAAPLAGLGLAMGMQHPTRVRLASDAPGSPDESQKPARIPIALQLYSVREEMAQDVPGTIKAVGGMGYDGVEFAGTFNYTAQDLRKILDDNELTCAGVHIGIDALLGDALEPTVEFHKILGCRFLIVPGLGPEYTGSKENWLKAADTFNAIAERLKPFDMMTGYHNHHTEFQPLESGDLPWDVFFGNTSKDVIMQFDTGNAMHGGASALPFLERYPGRALSIHLKEYSSTVEQPLIGEGDVPWAEIFELCETVGGTQWYVVEQESYRFPPLECVARCLENLKAMGK